MSLTRVVTRMSRVLLFAVAASVAITSLVNQKLAILFLQRLGYRADVAANGVEAVAAVTNAPHDVILMDVQMPEMDGLEATRRIRGDIPADRQPRIVAMTANAMADDRRKCLAAGMDDYLAKPIRLEEVAAALAACEPPLNGPKAELS
jgi:CheY-like chemotaxis protein